MPLSEDEQRILSEIEQQLYESDPALAREVSSTTVYTHSARSLKWSSLLFVVALFAMIFTLSTSYWLSFACFLVMLFAALAIERSARKLGRAGLEQFTQSLRGGRVRGTFDGASQKMRDRFKRADEE